MITRSDYWQINAGILIMGSAIFLFLVQSAANGWLVGRAAFQPCPTCGLTTDFIMFWDTIVTGDFWSSLSWINQRSPWVFSILIAYAMWRVALFSFFGRISIGLLGKCDVAATLLFLVSLITVIYTSLV